MENDKNVTQGTGQQNTGSQNTGRQTRWSARQLAIMAIFIALGALLGFIPIPILPAMPTITYDPANVPAILGGFVYGPGAGCIIGILSSLVHGLLVGDVIGTAMNMVAVVTFVIPAALILHKNKKSSVRLIVALVVGSLISVACMIPANFIGWYLYSGVPFEVTVTWVLPILLPFNLVKALLNSVLSFILYKSLYKLLER